MAAAGACAAVLPTAGLCLLPHSLLEMMFGHTLVGKLRIQRAIPDRLLPLSAWFFSAAVFRLACLDARRCRHPFVRRVYLSAGYDAVAGQRSLLLARAGRYDLAEEAFGARGAPWAAARWAAALRAIGGRALAELGAVYALQALARRVASRGGRGAATQPRALLARDFGRSVLFYVGAFGSVRALNALAAAACRDAAVQGPGCRCVGRNSSGSGSGSTGAAWRADGCLCTGDSAPALRIGGVCFSPRSVVRCALPPWFGMCMLWVAVDSVQRQRQVARFTAASALTTALRAAGLLPPPVLMAVVIGAPLFGPARGVAARLFPAGRGGARGAVAAAAAAALCAQALRRAR
eukprot:g7406.t1